MRGASRQGDALDVSVDCFAWPGSVVATLRHPTLPWFDAFEPRLSIVASPLTALKSAGSRDRLSLLGQFAAHVAMLQFAGIADAEFTPDEWVVVRKRGTDCRLVRIAAQRCAADETLSPMHNVLRFAEFVAAPKLESLTQSWTRAESVFADVFRAVRDDAAADARWLRRCAFAEILAPGADALEAMWARGGIATATDVAAFSAYAKLDDSARLAIAGTEFPIQPFSALATVDAKLPGSKLTPAEVADRLMEQRLVIVVAGNLDEQSRRVIEILSHDREHVAAPRRALVLSTRLSAQRAIENATADFVESDAFDAFLFDGTLPVDGSAFDRTPEPRRSYIAALALLGTRIPRTLASDFLRQFLFEQPLEDLVVHGVTQIDGDSFAFTSDAMRESCSRHIPAASRPALCRATAAVAIEHFEKTEWRSAAETIAALGALPRSVLTPTLASRLAHAYVDEARYKDAREIAPDDAFVLARCERRIGDYASALARVERIDAAQLLRAELLRLTGRLGEAATVLDGIEGEAADYERAILAIERREDPAPLPGESYLALRLATYRETGFDAAAELAARSFAAARCASERIDAALDRVFASFSSGRWSETRAIALDALALVDESQGDRAAAGILFTLTFIEADGGRWSAAAGHLERLQKFYAADATRLAELDLLAAHIEFTRGRFAEARRIAMPVLSCTNPQIREAAALIVDESDWIEARDTPLRSHGSANRELDERHQLMRLRRKLAVERPLTGFDAELARWEASPRGAPPTATTRSEKLKLFRSALGSARDAVAHAIASELSIAIAPAVSARTAADVEILRLAAVADYPFRADLFPVAWCHATRNRLGQWSQDGSRTFADLDRHLASPEGDWVCCSDRELLYLEGSATWPDASREAVAALFRTRAENHRLHRVVDVDEQPAPATPIDGFVGDSAPMRAAFALLDRIAQRDVPVCILGESGTGKELAGRAIHRASPRRHKPFTAINCAALPENLIESELFGHVRGAFTGADRDRAGLIETSDGGTLFLDEIGEMPPAAQAKLLRFLQDGEFRRVGDVGNRSADVRIVSATNRKLEAAVEEGRFREDLYYRVRGVEVVLPPLRERGEDILLLARHFLGRERARHKAGPQTFTADVEALLRAYEWPGNVRELQNTIRAAHAIAGDARAIDIEHLPERLRKVVPPKVTAGSYQDAVVRFRRDLIEKSLLAASGNQNRAAALLKISRQALAYQIRELGIMVTKSHPRAARPQP